MRSFAAFCRTPIRRKRPAAGFTLVELLITIGIIALLLGLALVGLVAAKRKAQVIRVQDDFQMITTALTQYRSDCGEYPHFVDPSAYITPPSVGSGIWLDNSSDRGARLLCRALISPGPANGTGIPDGQDGADGPGFRLRRNGISGSSTLGGRVYGPYLAADKFKLEFNPAVPNMADAKIMDSMGNVILYYPAQPGAPVLYPPQNSTLTPPPQGGYYVGYLPPLSYTPASSGSPAMVKPFYNAFDNTVDSTTGKAMLDLNQMEYLLGNVSMTGNITSPEVAATTAPYLLWTAGFDGNYGFGTKSPAPGLKTDDITSFDLAGAVKK